jgi:hypothetical protein
VTGLSPGIPYTFEVMGYRRGYSGPPDHVRAATDGTELPRVLGLRAEVVKSQGTTVKLSWDRPKDIRKERWVYGVYYGFNMSDLMQRKSLC